MGILVPSYSYHEFNGLKQHKFVILHFWKSEIQNHSQWLTSKCQQGWHVSLLFLASRGCLQSLAHGLPLHLQSQQHNTLNLLSLNSASFNIFSSVTQPLLLLSYKEDSCDNLPISRSLTQSHLHLWKAHILPFVRQYICRFWVLGCGHLGLH